MGISALQQSTLLNAELEQIVQQVRASVVSVYNRRGAGSGVIWRADGQIITNNHVVQGDHARVVLTTGEEFEAEVAARHPDQDVALLRIDATGLHAAAIGDSSRVRPGQLAIAVGHPVGYRDAATLGVIVAAGQQVVQEGWVAGDLLQTDVAIGPGSSGGPLVDAAGKVIGINTMVAGELSLAIPSNVVEHFVSNPNSRPGAYLGIAGIVAPIASAPGGAGIVVTNVETGSPADRAGLILGDVVLVIAGTPIVDQETLPAALLRLVPGEAVELAVARGGEPRQLSIIPTQRL